VSAASTPYRTPPDPEPPEQTPSRGGAEAFSWVCVALLAFVRLRVLFSEGTYGGTEGTILLGCVAVAAARVWSVARRPG